MPIHMYVHTLGSYSLFTNLELPSPGKSRAQETLFCHWVMTRLSSDSPSNRKMGWISNSLRMLRSSCFVHNAA